MSLYTSLLTSKNKFISIQSNDPKVVDHFNSTTSCAKLIINQINTDRFYDRIFNGKSNMTVLDIGANVGLFSLYAQDSCDKIYSIEPTPDHFYILNELTKDYDNIHPQNFALSNIRGEIDFFIDHGNSTMNSLINQSDHKITVKTKSLLNFCEDLEISKCDFVKIDIEGSEMVALTDETVSEVKHIIDNWFVEVHPTNVPYSNYAAWYAKLMKNRDTIVSIFRNNGYQVELQDKEYGMYITR